MTATACSRILRKMGTTACAGCASERKRLGRSWASKASRTGGRQSICTWRWRGIEVMICDDQVVVCEGLRAILSTAPGLEVVGVANDGEQALELTRSLHPEVVLMDLKMP